MLLKVGINKKGINSNVDTYVFNETFLSSDVEMIQKKLNNLYRQFQKNMTKYNYISMI